jgi:hypothetical protein
MVCCSANPFYVQRHVCRRFFSIHRKSITSAERRTKFPVSMFSLDVQSRYSVSSSSRVEQSAPSPAVLAAAFKTPRGAPRLLTRRTHETSRSEHDLNLAILYAVQSGFRYSASLLCLTCAADLLEPTTTEPTIMLRAFKATRHPHSKGDSVRRKLIGSGRYSKRFFIATALLTGL